MAEDQEIGAPLGLCALRRWEDEGGGSAVVSVVHARGLQQEEGSEECGFYALFNAVHGLRLARAQRQGQPEEAGKERETLASAEAFADFCNSVRTSLRRHGERRYRGSDGGRQYPWDEDTVSGGALERAHLQALLHCGARGVPGVLTHEEAQHIVYLQDWGIKQLQSCSDQHLLAAAALDRALDMPDQAIAIIAGVSIHYVSFVCVTPPTLAPTRQDQDTGSAPMVEEEEADWDEDEKEIGDEEDDEKERDEDDGETSRQAPGALVVYFDSQNHDVLFQSQGQINRVVRSLRFTCWVERGWDIAVCRTLALDCYHGINGIADMLVRRFSEGIRVKDSVLALAVEGFLASFFHEPSARAAAKLRRDMTHHERPVEDAKESAPREEAGAANAVEDDAQGGDIGKTEESEATQEQEQEHEHDDTGEMELQLSLDADEARVAQLAQQSQLVPRPRSQFPHEIFAAHHDEEVAHTLMTEWVLAVHQWLAAEYPAAVIGSTVTDTLYMLVNSRMMEEPDLWPHSTPAMQKLLRWSRDTQFELGHILQKRQSERKSRGKPRHAPHARLLSGAVQTCGVSHGSLHELYYAAAAVEEMCERWIDKVEEHHLRAAGVPAALATGVVGDRERFRDSTDPIAADASTTAGAGDTAAASASTFFSSLLFGSRS